MTPKASETGFFSALGDDEEDVPRRRNPAPEQPAGEPEHPGDPDQEDPRVASRARAHQRIQQATVAVAPKRRRPEPVHKVSVDINLSLVDGLRELYDRDRRGPKAEINEAIRDHLKKKNILVDPWKG